MKKAGILILFLLLTGCTALQQMVQAPTVKVEDVKLKDVSFQELTLDFGLNVNNPNIFGVQLLGFDYLFVIEDKEFLKGDQTQNVDILAQSANKVNIPLTLNFQDLYDLMTRVKSLDSLSFQMSGHFKPGGLLAGLDIPFSRTGKLPNVHIPKINLKGVKLNNLSFSGVNLNVDLGIENGNAFGFDLGKLNYAIKLGGNSVAEGITEKLASIPAKGTGNISIPVSLNFSGLSSSLYSMLTKKTIDCQVDGNAMLNSALGNFNLPINTKQNVSIFK